MVPKMSFRFALAGNRREGISFRMGKGGKGGNVKIPCSGGKRESAIHVAAVSERALDCWL